MYLFNGLLPILSDLPQLTSPRLVNGDGLCARVENSVFKVMPLMIILLLFHQYIDTAKDKRANKIFNKKIDYILGALCLLLDKGLSLYLW